MRNLIAIAAFAAIIAGCSDKSSPTEAELFGYKGADIEDQDDKMYFSSTAGVTNWVPTRVLQVSEKYDFSADELALVKAAGIITPSDSFEKLPAEFAEQTKEPWFTSFTKDAEAFGRKGVVGFLAHFDADKNVWSTGENYFSTYYGSEADARKALAGLEPEIAKFNPKKFYHFDNAWVAEYLRLRVMALCGQRPDGKWTCMLSINDKCRPGCGPWEPVEAQQARINEIEYGKKIKAWREVLAKTAAENHKAVLAKAAQLKIPLFGDEVKPQLANDGRMVYVRGGDLLMSNTVEQVQWDERVKTLESATNVKLGEITKHDYDQYDVWFATGSNDLFLVRLDIAFPKPQTNAVDRVAVGEYRELCFEQFQKGYEPLPMPKRK